jgi:hypothetical protein
MKYFIILLALIPSLVFTQTNEIPYSSKGNSLALTVENTAAIAAKYVTVEIQNPPSWLKLESSTCVLKDIPSRQSKDAEFQFSVEKTAPSGKEEKLKAVIRTADGQEWTKEIALTVGAPKEYRLYNNFPNPFNPSTKIAFELPITSKVKVVIYDALGRAIKTLTDEEHPAGYVELLWDGRNEKGANVASGVYYFQASAQNWRSVKKMIVMR